MVFEFATSSQIIFGPGTLEKVGQAAAAFGKKALVVAGYAGSDLVRLQAILAANGVQPVTFMVSGEPTIELVTQGQKKALEQGCDLVIGLGGGSAIDTGKAVAVLVKNPGSILDYLEVVGKNQPIREQGVPLIAIPTTAGTGSEVTRNAVLAVPEKKMKVSMRSPLMLARMAIVDPQLTFSLPPAITASTGMDAIAQVIEPFVSKRANPFTDLFCREGIRRGARSLLRAYEDGTDEIAREEMSFTSLMGGLALANAGLGAVHGFASPIGGMFDAPHGAVCACLLPPVVLLNTKALAQREPANPAIEKYEEAAQIALGSLKANIQDLIHWLDELRRSVGIPSLSTYGIRPEHLKELVDLGAAASSMKANPIVLTPQELQEILERAL